MHLHCWREALHLLRRREALHLLRRRSFASPLPEGSFASPVLAGSFASPVLQGSFASPVLEGSFASPVLVGSFASPVLQGNFACPVLEARSVPAVPEGGYSSLAGVLQRLDRRWTSAVSEGLSPHPLVAGKPSLRRTRWNILHRYTCRCKQSITLLYPWVTQSLNYMYKQISMCKYTSVSFYKVYTCWRRYRLCTRTFQCDSLRECLYKYIEHVVYVP